jgi:hypothetical protein
MKDLNYLEICTDLNKPLMNINRKQYEHIESMVRMDS